MSQKNDETIQANSRRDFLKGSLVAGVAGVASAAGVAGVAAAATPAPDAQKAAAVSAKPSWENPPEPIPESQIKSTVTADMVIIGAGIAGLVAAHAASEQGAKVVVLEKFRTFSVRGKDNAAVNTKVQKAAGYTIDPEMLIADLIAYSQNRVHQSLVRMWAYRSGEVFDHYIDLCEANGLGVKVLPPYNVSRTSPGYPTAHNWVKKGGAESMGSEYILTEVFFMELLERWVKEKGAEIHYSAPAQQLIKDKSGRITGVIAKVKGGYVKYLATKAVILATGGYSENKEMLRAWAPWGEYAESQVYTPPGGNMGDGINMACWAGAALANAPFAIMTHTIPAPPFGNDLMVANQNLLHVNRLGLRYENENQPDPTQCCSRFAQPGRKAWAIVDSKYEKDMSSLQTSMGGPVVEPIAMLEESVEKGRAFKGDSIAALAAKVGIPAKALEETVARYSELARKGKDEDFGKEPNLMYTIEQGPFYAIPIHAQLLVSVGSMNVDPNMQCLDKDDNPIPGLYAIGNMMGNFFGSDYPLIAPGLSHGRAITLSYILGQQLAKA
ncbi:FAD-dependent oxidoreductase [Telmatospirillum siberiense]|uniref:FAD-binding dehydrogenase n=1 Tax=Telmatospirillum siberiense TaxID=382514 RepID=A0A2N3Q0E9_9PROT|nr:FAD-dependent oxidoreductase [Telmatospirillum siberiense]PKU26112.1 FAD-binding dehydrogenase [Telmatospirillum siberiense]